jgi:hypothetical protein
MSARFAEGSYNDGVAKQFAGVPTCNEDEEDTFTVYRSAGKKRSAILILHDKLEIY